MEQEYKLVFVEERQPEDPDSLLACKEKDLFSQEEDLSDCQLLAAVTAPTQEDSVVPARSQEVEELLQPLPVTSWTE